MVKKMRLCIKVFPKFIKKRIISEQGILYQIIKSFILYGFVFSDIMIRIVPIITLFELNDKFNFSNIKRFVLNMFVLLVMWCIESLFVFHGLLDINVEKIRLKEKYCIA